MLNTEYKELVITSVTIKYYSHNKNLSCIYKDGHHITNEIYLCVNETCLDFYWPSFAVLF